ncbi:MAG TPA: hypothetical protein VKS22_13220 [Candidatus Binataceae bacterium]|nr:hypothetical protein [Candidatus Binataceae bacterium]
MTFYTGKIREPLLEGVEIDLKGQKFTVPPSNIRREKLMIGDSYVLQKGVDHQTPEQQTAFTDALIHVALVALEPNYPELTSALLEEQLQTRDLMPIFIALRKANGFNDEEPAAGEVAGPQGGPATPATGIS